MKVMERKNIIMNITQKNIQNSIQTDLYNERSIINKQIDLRNFIEVETY